MGSCSSAPREMNDLPEKGKYQQVDAVQLTRPTLSRDRDSLCDIISDNDLDDHELTAVRKIQKSMRRTKALSKANADNHWRFFAQVDNIEEFETLRMAAFMDALVNLVPGAKELRDGPESQSTKGLPKASKFLLDDIILEDDFAQRGKNVLSGFSSAASSLSHSAPFEEVAKYKIRSNGNTSSDSGKIDGGYQIKGNITADTCKCIVELFRPPNVGYLDLKALTKILRAVYKTLKTMKNINEISIPQGGRATVIGDLHGQLEDLYVILDEAGEPSPTNILLFNGDFVDRGPHGCEVITLIFAYFVAYPGCVFLNRGNHEDSFVCCNYGFQTEIIKKYDQMTFFVIAEVFKYLPLCSVLNGDVFVVHGGLFHNPNATLADLAEIDRADYEAVPKLKFPDCVAELPSDDVNRRKEYLKQLQRDALWSDPRDIPGVSPNSRGAGYLFGPDVATTFLTTNKLSMLIRSHECVKRGVDFPFNRDNRLEKYYEAEEAAVGRKSIDSFYKQSLPLGEQDPLVVTLFSASNYLNGDNEGAYMVLRYEEKADVRRYASTANATATAILASKFHFNTKCVIPSYANPIRSTGLFFTCHRFRTTLAHDMENSSLGQQITTQITANDLLLRKRRALTGAFRAIDKSNSECITLEKFAQVLREVTGLKILWLNLVPHIVPAHALLEKGVLYMEFLGSLRAREQRDRERSIFQQPSSAGTSTSSSQILDLLYGNKKRMMELIFFFFDTDGDGLITASEFHDGCARLNHIGKESAEAARSSDGVHVAPYELKDVSTMMQIMDFKHTGDIDINEFFEAFRLASLVPLMTEEERKTEAGHALALSSSSEEVQLLL